MPQVDEHVLVVSVLIDEAHNIPQTCEDTASFQIGTKQLEDVLTELTELQDQRHQNTDQELKSTDSSITRLKLLTGSFKTFLDDYDVFDKTGGALDIQNSWLTRNSCVLPGSKIFELMFRGTKFSDCDAKT